MLLSEALLMSTHNIFVLLTESQEKKTDPAFSEYLKIILG